MDPLLVRLGQAATRRGTQEVVSPEFRESYPALAALMEGCAAENGNAGVPAMTVRLFWEAGDLKACVGRYNHPVCIFARISDPVKALESLDRVLASGGGEVRRAKS